MPFCHCESNYSPTPPRQPLPHILLLSCQSHIMVPCQLYAALVLWPRALFTRLTLLLGET